MPRQPALDFFGIALPNGAIRPQFWSRGSLCLPFLTGLPIIVKSPTSRTVHHRRRRRLQRTAPLFLLSLSNILVLLLTSTGWTRWATPSPSTTTMTEYREPRPSRSVPPSGTQTAAPPAYPTIIMQTAHLVPQALEEISLSRQTNMGTDVNL